MATQLFLRRGQFRSAEPTFTTVRAEEIDRNWGYALRTINRLARTANHLTNRVDALDAMDEQLLADSEWGRDRMMRDAVTDGVPPVWINYAQGLGERGMRLGPDELLPTPWVDHRARLVCSIRGDVDRLTVMASASAVRAHRGGVTDAIAEAASTDQLERNMSAILTSAARTAEAIGADDDECRQWWHVSPAQWRTAIGAHLGTEPAEFDRRWAVYTDPDIDTHVAAFIENLPLYAELASATGSPPSTGTGTRPPDPSAWMSSATDALNAALNPSSAQVYPSYDVVFETVEDVAVTPAWEWEPRSETAMEQDGSLPPSINDQGPEPGV
ncbi:hypothetical protein [Nocardia brasiliensis]|uniref:hypothetical protein n=1 Tax=Nocardia brasiliensis TaxID=37326 RepID=UPI00366C21A9